VLWPEQAANPPAYFFVWDTRGVDPANATTVENIHEKVIGGLLEGDLRVDDLNLNQRQARNDPNPHDFPRPNSVIWVKTFGPMLTEDLPNTNPPAPLLRLANKAMEDHPSQKDRFVKVPLYLAMSQADGLDINAPFDTLITDDRLIEVMHKVHNATGIPMGRIFPTFGLHSLKPSGAACFHDPREVAVLQLFVSAIRESETSFAINRDQHVRMCVEKKRDIEEWRGAAQPQADVTGSVFHATPRCLGELLKAAQRDDAHQNAVQAMSNICTRLEENDVDGRALIEMSDETIDRLFEGIDYRVGAVETVKRLVRPYRFQAQAPGRIGDSRLGKV